MIARARRVRTCTPVEIRDGETVWAVLLECGHQGKLTTARGMGRRLRGSVTLCEVCGKRAAAEAISPR